MVLEKDLMVIQEIRSMDDEADVEPIQIKFERSGRWITALTVHQGKALRRYEADVVIREEREEGSEIVYAGWGPTGKKQWEKISRNKTIIYETQSDHNALVGIPGLGRPPLPLRFSKRQVRVHLSNGMATKIEILPLVFKPENGGAEVLLFPGQVFERRAPRLPPLRRPPFPMLAR